MIMAGYDLLSGWTVERTYLQILVAKIWSMLPFDSLLLLVGEGISPLQGGFLHTQDNTNMQ
jgi:hypothetical protein